MAPAVVAECTSGTLSPAWTPGHGGGLWGGGDCEMKGSLPGVKELIPQAANPRQKQVVKPATGYLLAPLFSTSPLARTQRGCILQANLWTHPGLIMPQYRIFWFFLIEREDLAATGPASPFRLETM